MSEETNTDLRKSLEKNFNKMTRKTLYRLASILLGLPTFIMMTVLYLTGKKDGNSAALREAAAKQLKDRGVYDAYYKRALESERRRKEYFHLKTSDRELEKAAADKAGQSFGMAVEDEWKLRMKQENVREWTLYGCFGKIMRSPVLLAISVVTSFPMYLLLLIYGSPYCKYIFERIIMMVFVVFGVTFLVFTILHFSPADPAINILGDHATPEQIVEFKAMYGLDKPYISQLFESFRKLVTFDLGKSYVGNEDVLTAIGRKFPITLQLAFMSLFVSVLIAIPAGIISAIRQYSAFDYISMFVALLGLSIPNFWLGLILILTFSIRLGILPAIYEEGNWLTLVMPAIVIGTGMAASMARMTRSSMLEVKNQDYVMTARAKGLSERRVVLKHILGNAMIPIVTIIGLQFGSMLGGAAVTEKVFNVNGIGSYIVNKQFIPDIPVVLAGVVYVALIISFVNLIVDILYAFLDPRIKSKMKNY